MSILCSKGLQYLPVGILFGILISLSLAASAFSPPPEPPPQGNTDAPLTVGPDVQEKTGGLILGSGLSAEQIALYIAEGGVQFSDDSVLKSAVPQGDLAGYVRHSAQTYWACDNQVCYDTGCYATTPGECQERGVIQSGYCVPDSAVGKMQYDPKCSAGYSLLNINSQYWEGSCQSTLLYACVKN